MSLSMMFTMMAGIAVPGISITKNLPAPQVGVAYTGSIVATNTGSATGAITFSADVLPAGLSLGTVTSSGASYTQPITGTPTMAGTVASTFTVTNGTQTAYPTNSFMVAAASTVPVLVQRKTVSVDPIGSGTASVTFAAPTTSGNLLTASYQGYNYNTFAVPAGWTEVGTAQVLNITYYGIRYFTKTSDGTENGISFVVNANNYRGVVITISEYSGAKVGTRTSGALGYNWTTVTYRAGPTDAPISAAALPELMVAVDIPDTSLVGASPWAGGFVGTTAADDGACGAYFTQPAPNAAVSNVITRAGTAGAQIGWMSVWIEPI